MLFGLARERLHELVDADHDLIGCLAQQDGQRRVQHVGGRHPQVQPARRLTREFLNIGEKRDDIVLGPLLDFQNLLGLQLASGPPTHIFGCSRGNTARGFHGPTGGQFDAQPGLVAMGIGPQFGQRRSRVAFNHGAVPCRACSFSGSRRAIQWSPAPLELDVPECGACAEAGSRIR